MPRKILYSTGYGAGWSTWNSGEVAKFVLEYQPIIDFIEGGGSFSALSLIREPEHPLLDQLKAECRAQFGKDTYVCVLGADGLQVAVVDGPVLVTEYDGFESFDTPDSIEWS